MEADLLPLAPLLLCLLAAGIGAARLRHEYRPLAWIVLLDVLVFGLLDWSSYAFVTTVPADYAGELPRHFVDDALRRGLVGCGITAGLYAVVERGRGPVWPAVIATTIATLSMAACAVAMALVFTQVLWVGGR